MILPTEKTVPTINLSDKIILIHGEPKIGKSTLASQFPDAIFIATEDGLRSIECTQIAVTGWMTGQDRGGRGMREVIQALRGESHSFKTIVVDTVDLAWAYCDEYVASLYEEKTSADVSYGKGYAALENEFRLAVADILALKLGVVFISHSTVKEDLKTKSQRVVTTLHDRGRKYIEGAADIILYATQENGERVIKTKPDPRYVAGDRTGRLPDTLPIDYSKIVEHFYQNNEGETAGEALIKRIVKGESYLAEHEIDGFDVSKRVDGSREKHLGTVKLDGFTDIIKLEEYFRHLLIKARKTDGTSA